MKTNLLFSLLIIIPAWCFSQDKVVTTTPEIDYSSKKMPVELEDAIKKALSYYPELEHTRIDFIFKNKINKSVMQAQPRVRTLFRGKTKRTYKVKISRYLVLSDTIKAIEDVPLDILVGWIAHELGHVMDYRERTAFQMIGFGFRYVTSLAFLMKAERKADIFAIHHGLADKIIKTKNYILYREDLPKEYKQRISRLYISPEEVETILEEEEM